MKSKQVILELQSNRLDVILYEGDRQKNSARIKTELDSDPHKWVQGVEKLQRALDKAVEDMGIRGLPAIVFYSNSTQVVELVSTDVKSVSDACSVARLRCIDSLPFSSLSSVCDAKCLGKDTGREENKIHVLGAADREDALGALAQLVEQSGLRFDYASPISASIFQGLYEQGRKKSSECRGRLYLGERHSYFLITDRGRLVFSRLINIGFDAMARSLTRPIRTEASPIEIELDFDEARRILLECGIPNKQVMVDETRGLSSKEIIPLMQPVLQRLLVELRQSLRFGLTEHQRTSVQIEISGPGCALDGIEEYLGKELELEIKPDLSYRGFNAGKPAAAGGELLDVIRCMEKHPPVFLQPESYAQACRLGKLRQWLWAGAAAAVLLIAMDGVGYHMRLDDLRRGMESVDGLSEQYDHMQQNGEMLRAAIVALDELNTCVDNELGTMANYQAAMQEIARLTPEKLRFTKMSLHRTDSNTQLLLTGYAFEGETLSSGQTLQAFMTTLADSPLFLQTRIVNVQNAEHENRVGQRFEISGTLVHVLCNPAEQILTASVQESSR